MKLIQESGQLSYQIARFLSRQLFPAGELIEQFHLPFSSQHFKAENLCSLLILPLSNCTINFLQQFWLSTDNMKYQSFAQPYDLFLFLSLPQFLSIHHPIYTANKSFFFYSIRAEIFENKLLLFQYICLSSVLSYLSVLSGPVATRLDKYRNAVPLIPFTILTRHYLLYITNFIATCALTYNIGKLPVSHFKKVLFPRHLRFCSFFSNVLSSFSSAFLILSITVITTRHTPCNSSQLPVNYYSVKPYSIFSCPSLPLPPSPSLSLSFKTYFLCITSNLSFR